ncbi:1341_t:CDS:2, partial [Cetraspora pellucida]
LETVDQKGILLSTEWELTRRRMIKLLEFPVKQNIKGAEKYLNSLENFFIFIDAYIKAKIEEIESSEEFLQINLQEELSKSKKERLEQIIKNYKSNLDSKNDDEIRLQLIENLINTKLWMMIYLENYLGAYEYWSLSKSAIKLSVIKQFRDYQKDMHKICQELIDALEQSVIIEIPLNCELLSDYAHLKLHAFRVYLEGVGSENDIISLHISNT